MTDGTKEIVSVLSVILGVVLLLVAGGGVIAYGLERKACDNRAGEMGLDWKFKLIGGCFVELPSGRYVNLGNIRFTEQGQILVEP